MNINSVKNYFLSDELARHCTVMFMATTLAGIFNYLYQIYMGRALGPEDYGVFGALFAIFYMIMVISQTLGTSTARFVSRFIGEGKQIGFFLSGSIKRTAALGIMVSVIFIALSSRLIYLLKLPDGEPILVLALILVVTWVASIYSGALRGVKDFSALGIVNISNTLFKLAFGVLLVILGFGVSGALLGVAAGMFVSLILSMIFLRSYFRQDDSYEPDFNYTSFYSYSLPVMLAMFCLTVPANLDVVLAKYFFSSTDAGLYTSISVLGKIIFFFPTGIQAVMFPMIAEKHAQGENTTTILMKSLLYTALLAGSVAVGYLLFPHLAISVFGAGYAAAIPLVAPYGFAMFFFSLTVIVMHYHLAIKNMGYIAFFAGFTFLEVILFFVFNSSIQEMVNILLLANLSLLLISLFYTWRCGYDIGNSADV